MLRRNFPAAKAFLLFLLLASVPLAAGTAAPKAKAKAPGLAVELSFLDHASRAKVGEQTLSLALDFKSAEHPISVGGKLASWRARTLAREVKVNGKASGYWIELTLLGPDGSERGYLAVTLPRDPDAAFSAATKVTAGKDGVPLDAVLTRAP